MAITLSQADYDLLWQQANPRKKLAEQADAFEFKSLVPEQLGQGYIQEIQWRGINLMLFNYRLHDDVFVKQSAQDASSVSREIGFNLSGNRSGRRSGENFIDWGIDDGEDWTFITYANDPILKVDIHLESSEGLVQMVADALDRLPSAVLQQMTKGDWLSEVNAMTPAMRVAIEQILHCPFQGETRLLYLESKCLELIALKLEQIKMGDRKTESACFLKPEDIERIHLAKTILTKNAEYPPSLMALARQVNLNDYKLKVGFRQVFGTTVFGYLHQYRMTKARRLLSEQQMNVKEVAQTVGYANQSRFAAAFRKQFGINPKAYVLSKRC
ncbi:MAG: helix-turn-helix transcriptional regulator [Phormidesmis sp. RL_2_1]|nr:helix-turn-helix transcriptional regulator [Phormidesmis sp. RL_2_1]